MGRPPPAGHLIATALAILCISCGQHAAQDAGAESVTLDYQRADLTHAADVDKLYGQIRLAATKVCRAARTPEIETERCIHATLSHTVRQIDAPLLTERHRRARATPP